MEDAQRLMARKTMANGYAAARLNFLRALVLYEENRIPLGDESLAAAMGYMQHGSPWLFQIALMDRVLVDRRMQGLTTRAASAVYQTLLRDPQPADWNLNPMESLAVLVTPHARALSNWFLLAMGRQDHDPDTAFEVAERIRRHRFFSSLPFGGRLQCCAGFWKRLPKCWTRRRGCSARTYWPSSRPMRTWPSGRASSCAKLKQMPLVARDGPVLQAQSRALQELAEISAEQEGILRQMAVRREPADLVFPPLRSLKQVQRSLPSGHALLAFLAVGNERTGSCTGSR